MSDYGYGQESHLDLGHDDESQLLTPAKHGCEAPLQSVGLGCGRRTMFGRLFVTRKLEAKDFLASDAKERRVLHQLLDKFRNRSFAIWAVRSDDGVGHGATMLAPSFLSMNMQLS